MGMEGGNLMIKEAGSGWDGRGAMAMLDHMPHG